MAVVDIFASSGFGMSLSQLVQLISDRSDHGTRLLSDKYDGVEVRMPACCCRRLFDVPHGRVWRGA